MSEETAFQSEEWMVTSVLLPDLLPSRGLSCNAAKTLVTAVFGELRLYQETLMLPFWSELRRPGMKCQPLLSVLSRTGAV